MMGQPQSIEPKLFYTNFNLSDRIRQDHPLRAIAAKVDFNFVRSEVAGTYGQVGNPSVDPAVVLKLMFLLFYEDVKSERALAERLGERLDWMWFCGYDLDCELPNHSVLSKARRRWGKKVFVRFFKRIVLQCVQAGLVDGKKVYADGSVQKANAGKDTLEVYLRLHGERLYDELEEATEEASIGELVSSTDQDARLTRKYGQTTLGYKDHRIVDDRCGVITSTVTTDAATAEAEVLSEALDQHRANTGQGVQAVTADKGYGTAEVYKDLKEQGIQPCIPHKQSTEASDGKFRRSRFIYDKSGDCYTCPAGQRLHRRGRASDERWRYRAEAGVCNACPLRMQCTDNKQGRLLSRHVQQETIDWADNVLPGSLRRQRMRRRKYLMEGSFADAANNHGYKRARWRGLAQMTIQNLLIAAVQNIRKLIRYGGGPPVTAMRNLPGQQQGLKSGFSKIIGLFWSKITKNRWTKLWSDIRLEFSSGVASGTIARPAVILVFDNVN